MSTSSIVTLAVIIVCVVVVLAVVSRIAEHSRKHGKLTAAGRWIAGIPLDGQPRTPAGRDAARRGTGKKHPDASRRALARHLATIAILATAWGLAAHRTATLRVFAVIAAVAILAGIWHFTWTVRNWTHVKDNVQPLEQSLATAGIPARDAQVARDHSKVWLEFGPDFDVQAKEKVSQAVLAAVPRIAIAGPPGIAWSQSPLRRRPVAVFTKAEPMPGFVAWAEILAAAEAAAEHEMVLGLTRKGASDPFIVSVDSDSPHLGLSMPTGDGKSVTARLAAAQLAYHGALTVVLDRKLVSHQWAAGLPNVAYARTIEDVHQLALWLAAEVDRRNALAVLHADVEGKVHANPGPRIVALLEELNATAAELKSYWRSIGGKGMSPAVIALDRVAFTGRAVAVNLVYIGQRLSAKATGGGSADSRENLGLKLISNPAASTWKMLVGDRHPLPAGSDVKGRLHVVTAKTSTEIQAAFMTGAEARAWATAGVIASAAGDMPCLGIEGTLAPLGTPERAAQEASGTARKLALRLVPDSGQVADTGESGPDVPASRGHMPALPPPPEPLTIAELVDREITGPTPDAVKKQMQRDRAAGKPVPEPVRKKGSAPAYDPVEIADWEEERRLIGSAAR
jgi:hypothetical protein